MDFQQPAGLYTRRKSTTMGRPPSYRRFASLAMAVRHAVEEQSDLLIRCSIECGELSLDHRQIRDAYESDAGRAAIAALREE